MDIPLEQIQQLPIADQLRLVEQIWDGLHESSDLVREWHRVEARRRAAELDADESTAITREQMWKRVDHSDG